MTETLKILYVEDEPFLARVVNDYLKAEGYEVIFTNDGGKALVLYEQTKPHLCLFDIMLPNTDGITLAKEIRKRDVKTPIVLITAKGEGKDVVEGFDSGATEYIKKPFSLDELNARIKHQFKVYSTRGNNNDTTIDIEGLSFSFNKQQLKIGEACIDLSYKEAQILQILFERANDDVERDFIMQTVWHNDDYYTSRNLDVYIRKLRKYLEGHEALEILTLKGVGYRLVK